MKKNKILSLILTLIIIVFALTACGNSKQNHDDSTGGSNFEKTKFTVENVDVEVIDCAFDYELMGIDEEASGSGYTKTDGKVYVNLALKVVNNSEKTLVEDDFSGYVFYEDIRYDMKYSVEDNLPVIKNNRNDEIHPGNVAIIYLLTRVDEAAINSELEVTYTVLGKEKQHKVFALDTRDAFDKKTELKIGDKLNVSGLYDVEVIDCSLKNGIQASNAGESKQYVSLGNDKIVDLVLKIKNNSKVELFDLEGYISLDDSYIRTSARIETENNTDIDYLSDEPIKPGEEGIVHIITTVEEGANTEGLAIRINFLENCYYCKAS